MAQPTAARGKRKRAKPTSYSNAGEIKRRVHSGFYHAAKTIDKTMSAQSATQVMLSIVFCAIYSFSSLPGGVHPFACAAFAVCLLRGISVPAAFAGCALATLAGYDASNILQWWSLPACALIWMSCPLWNRKSNRSVLRAMIVVGVSLLVPLPFVWHVSFARILLCFMNAAAGAVMIPVFERVVLVCQEKKRFPQKDDALCTVLCASILLLGLYSIGFPGQVLATMLSACLVFTICYHVPGSTGIVIGAAFGVVGAIYTGRLSVFSMLFGGALLLVSIRRDALILSACIFILGTLFGFAVSAEQLNLLWNLLPITVGVAFANFLPDSWIDGLVDLCPESPRYISPQADGASLHTAITLRQWARQMNILSDKLPQVHIMDTNENRINQIEDIAQKLCEGCDNKHVCWNDQFDMTKNYMGKLVEAAFDSDMNTVKIQAQLLGCTDTNRLELMLWEHVKEEWSKREEEAHRQERKALTSMQIQGMAEAIGQLSESFFSEVKPDDVIYRKIQREIMRLGIEAKISYALCVKGRLEVMMIRSGTCTVDELKRVADIACGMQMQPSAFETLVQTEVMFEQAAKLETLTCAASCMKEGERVAGDGYIARALTGGRQLIALSDGMGSGEKAYQESQATLHLLLQCLKAGYTRSQALIAVNSILLSCAGSEMFATMDLCLVDLHTGETAFEKLGACTSFVIRAGECRAIGADTLPMGVIAQVEPRSYRMRLREDDLIVMVSDGIADSYPNGEAEISKLLVKMHNMHPQIISDTVLNRALRLHGGIAVDDMTVVCTKIQRSQWIY